MADPPTIALMHATQVSPPFHTKGWVYTKRSTTGMAKDPESPYIGGRTLKWLKVKQPKYRVEERGWDPRNKS